MKMGNNFDLENNLFFSQRVDRVAILRFKTNPLFKMTDLENKATLFNFLDFLCANDEVNVVLIDDSAQQLTTADYVDLFRQIAQLGIQERIERLAFSRYCNAINQFILKLFNCDKFIIHSDSGIIISLFMNISLACDYRIIGEDSLFQNPFFELGLVPKGGGTFFLPRMIGAYKAREVLFSKTSISANNALEIGIVDKVVPTQTVFESALEVARAYSELPCQSLSGIKKLMNCCDQDLNKHLKCENDLLYQLTCNSYFINKLHAYAN